MEKRIPLLSLDEQRALFGPYDRHLRELERLYGVRLSAREGMLRMQGPAEPVTLLAPRVEAILEELRGGAEFSSEALLARLAGPGPAPVGGGTTAGPRPVREAELPAPRTPAQEDYLRAMESADLVIATGPAGTGKTFLAVAAAIRQLREGRVQRLVLTRPAVEAGERLGFLPGDYEAKVDPYLRPLYDALHDILGPAGARRLKDLELVEIAPLAFMRGRTLNHAFLIVDEAQNATVAQMKMLLTRLGEGSRAVVTGDRTQSDLPEGQSGLDDALRRLQRVAGVVTIEFTRRDIQRSGLVQRIVRAYGEEEEG